MDQKQAQTIADELFPHYPKATEVHVTTDGQAFFNKSDADSHAASLKTEPITIKRGEKTDDGLKKLSKAEAIEKAKAQVEKAESAVKEQEAALESAPDEKTKKSVQKKLDKANSDLSAAKTALEIIENEAE